MSGTSSQKVMAGGGAHINTNKRKADGKGALRGTAATELPRILLSQLGGRPYLEALDQFRGSLADFGAVRLVLDVEEKDLCKVMEDDGTRYRPFTELLDEAEVVFETTVRSAKWNDWPRW